MNQESPPLNWLRRQCPVCGLFVTGLIHGDEKVAEHGCNLAVLERLERIASIMRPHGKSTMASEQTTNFQRLSLADKARVKLVIDSVVDMLNEYADMMERSDLESMSGPEALRWVAKEINNAK